MSTTTTTTTTNDDDNECSNDDTLVAVTACILTYAGSVRDMWINYATFALVLTAAALRGRRRRSSSSSSTRWKVATLVAFLGVVAFQIGLCWIVHCTGISIIWCAVTGWLVNEQQQHQQQQGGAQQEQTRSWWEDLTLTVVLSVLIYYAVVAPVITTVAHGCALILGALLSRLVPRIFGSRNDNNINEATGYETIGEESS